jgi:hypothetical protein
MTVTMHIVIEIEASQPSDDCQPPSVAEKAPVSLILTDEPCGEATTWWFYGESRTDVDTPWMLPVLP